jgi:hypothetical protein
VIQDQIGRLDMCANGLQIHIQPTLTRLQLEALELTTKKVEGLQLQVDRLRSKAKRKVTVEKKKGHGDRVDSGTKAGISWRNIDLMEGEDEEDFGAMRENIREGQEDLEKKKAGLKERGPDFGEEKEDSKEGIMYPSLERKVVTARKMSLQGKLSLKEKDAGKEDGENIRRNEEHLGESMESLKKGNDTWTREEDAESKSTDSGVWDGTGFECAMAEDVNVGAKGIHAGEKKEDLERNNKGLGLDENVTTNRIIYKDIDATTNQPTIVFENTVVDRATYIPIATIINIEILYMDIEIFIHTNIMMTLHILMNTQIHIFVYILKK